MIPTENERTSHANLDTSLRKLVAETGLTGKGATQAALALMAGAGELGRFSGFFRHFGTIAFPLGRAIVPTNIYVLQASGAPSDLGNDCTAKTRLV